MQHVLFICGRNRLRSPTAEAIFASWPGIAVASAGMNPDADTPVGPELLEWADLIFVMERSHRTKLSTKFRAHLRDRRIVCLNIPDKYEYMDPQLIEKLMASVPPHLGTTRFSETDV